ncbi:xanthine dehydrogenase family protein molybdopterin-binding subunit (plasmid) [Pseudohalocynthiibacter aestuariivivens]|nr:xanthine dehydrogenase family protein molybdopterin-binding subunit [Pseudohalocynthiibacter aestuariivivens]QIE48095.1 xanthine dehydrogenase family protein molybdopterin-binding subunit [Pseudohalocynthiibacter aestuariivivens]
MEQFESDAFSIGKPVKRREDERFLRGKGRYVADFGEPGDLCAIFVRSPYAHARVASVDTSTAAAMPGVHAVYTARDLQEGGVGSIGCGWLLRNKDGSPMAEPPHFPLCIDTVRHVGDPVAVVIADSTGLGKDAAEAVEIDFEELDAIVDTAAAPSDIAPQIWPEAPRNTCADWEIGDPSSTRAALEAAPHVVEIDIVNNRLVANPMEPRAARAYRDTSSGRYTLYTTSQNPHTIKNALCGGVLDIAEHDLRVVSPDVGGGFGTKIFLYPEEVVVTWATRHHDRPIRWTSERSEGFMTDAQGRDHVSKARLALDEDGLFQGLWVDTIANVGAYLSQGATAIPTFYYAPLLSGVYRIPEIYCNVRVVFTNTTPVDAYRGAGRPEASYLLERLVDAAARQIGMDRAEIRRRNFIPPDAFPYETPVGLTYDVGDHHATLDIALDQVDYAGFEERRKASAENGKLRGLGLSTYVEVAGGVPSRISAQLGSRGARFEAVEVRVSAKGHVTILCGTHSHGQSHETTFPQLVCDKLGIAYDKVAFVQGDTDRVHYGRGTAASRSLAIGGAAIVKALDKIIDKGKSILAYSLDVDRRDIDFDDGAFSVAGTNQVIPFDDLCRMAYLAADFPPDEIEPGLAATAYYDPENWTYPGGCHICELEVDPELGTVQLLRVVAVDDVGRVVNPMVVHGQLHGGLAQGIGQALLESTHYDTETGQLLSASFMDYAMPRAADIPMFEISTHETLCTHNPLGSKGCAEVGSVGVPPAIINAVIDALRPLGVDSIDMPATPCRIWSAINVATSKPDTR